MTPGAEINAVGGNPAANVHTLQEAVASEVTTVKAQIQGRQNELNAMQTVSDIRVPADFKQLDMAGKQNWVVEKLRSTDYKVERKGLGVINFAKKQLKSAFNYFSNGGAEEAVFEALPNVLKHGIEISSHDNHKGRNYQTITIAAPVTVNGKRGNMAVVVKRTTDNFYKVHRILSPDGSVFNLSETMNEAEPTPAGESPETGSLATPISSASYTSIAKDGDGVNPQGGNYAASEDGKTYFKDEAVTVSGVASIAKDGSMKLKLEDGRTVDAEEISYGSADEAVMYETLAGTGMNATAANMLLGNYEADSGLSAAEYAKGVEAAYIAGTMNYPMADVARMDFAAQLAPNQRKMAYQLGELFGGKKTAKEQAIAQKGRAAGGVDTSRGKVHFDGDRSSLNDTQRASLGVMEMLAKTLGVQIYVFESEVEADGRRKGANGWYDTSDGSIHIDLYAGADGKGTMLFTVAHELTHFIRQWSPAKFKVLANFLMKQYGERGVSVDELVQNQIDKAKRNGRELSYEEAYEEVVADSMEAMLADGSVVEMMADLRQQDKTLWEKVRGWFKDFADKLKAALHAYEGVKPDSAEGKLVADMRQDIVGVMESLYAAALVDASENFNGGAQKNVAYKGGVKYSFGVTQDVINDYVDAAYEKNNTEDYKKYAIPTMRLINDVSGEVNIQGYAHALRDNDIRHIRNSHGEGTNEKYPVTKEDLKIIPWLVENYDKVFVVKRSGNKTGIIYVKAISGGVTYYLEQVATVYGNEPLLINKQMIKTGAQDIPDIKGLKDAITKKQSETEFLNDLKKVPQVYVHDVYQYRSIDSIDNPELEVKKKLSDRASDGNKLSEGQQEYFKDSKERDGQGRLRVMYRGDSTEVTVFDRKKSSYSNLYGRGFYFTSSDSHAGQYGKATAYFLNIINPVSTTDCTISKEQMRKFLEVVAENEDDYSFENYGYGATVEGVLEGLYTGRSDFSMLYDVSQTAIGDMVAATELFNEVNGTAFDGIILDTETVIFNSNQAKRVDNVNPTANPDTRLSDRDPDHQKVNKVLARENARLREDVSYLKELVKLQRQVTGGTKFTKTSVEAAAQYLKRNADAKGNTKELAGLLNTLYEYIAASEELTWEGVKEQAQPAVDWLQEHR